MPIELDISNLMHFQPPSFFAREMLNPRSRPQDVIDQPGHFVASWLPRQKPHSFTASKTGRCLSALSPPCRLIVPTTTLQAARTSSSPRIRLGGPVDLEVGIQQRFLTYLQPNTHSQEQKPHAAFTTTMADDFEEFIDWSKGDLLDACYDPAIGGMGLDR